MKKANAMQEIKVSEEQSFWETHNPLEYIENTVIEDHFTSLKPSTKIITLRVPEHLLNNLKLIANKRDIPYQSLLKSFLYEKVNDALKSPFNHLKRQSVRKATLAGVSLIFTSILSYAFLVSPIQAQGSAMAPNYPTNTYYWLDKVTYKVEVPERGDVVVFYSPVQSETKYFKRIIGLPGDAVGIQDGVVYINEETLFEPYSQGTTNSKAFPKDGQNLIVPGNSYFVLGDNREASTDSRDFGFITKESIIGRVSSCYWNCQS